MATFYITNTEKSSSDPKSVRHIIAYGIYDRPNGDSYYYNKYSKEDFFKEIYNPKDEYYTYNWRTKDSAKLEYKPNNGSPFLQSEADGTENDNLLKLPNC